MKGAMRTTQELSVHQIVRYTDTDGTEYNGAIIRDIDRTAGQVFVSINLTRSGWVDVAQIEVPR